MEENKNMEQAGVTSAITEKKNESRKREASGKDVLAIRSFLESLSVYEADALRVSIAIADGKTTASNISADDRLALNRYLNSGKDNERMTVDNAQEHRLNRAFQLLERVAEFCDKRQLVTVNRSLLSIAVDAADISRAVSSLDKRPASGQPFPKQYRHQWRRKVTVCDWKMPMPNVKSNKDMAASRSFSSLISD